MIYIDKIPVRYGPYTIVTDFNEVADQYWRCRSPARARRRLNKKGIVGRILLGIPSVSLVRTTLRVHPYMIRILRMTLEATASTSLTKEEALRWATSFPSLTPRIWRPERDA